MKRFFEELTLVWKALQKMHLKMWKTAA